MPSCGVPTAHAADAAIYSRAAEYRAPSDHRPLSVAMAVRARRQRRGRAERGDLDGDARVSGPRSSTIFRIFTVSEDALSEFTLRVRTRHDEARSRAAAAAPFRRGVASLQGDFAHLMRPRASPHACGRARQWGWCEARRWRGGPRSASGCVERACESGVAGSNARTCTQARQHRGRQPTGRAEPGVGQGARLEEHRDRPQLVRRSARGSRARTLVRTRRRRQRCVPFRRAPCRSGAGSGLRRRRRAVGGDRAPARHSCAARSAPGAQGAQRRRGAGPRGALT